MSSTLFTQPGVSAGVKQFLVFPDIQELIPAKTRQLTDFRVLIEFESGVIGSFHTAGRTIPTSAEFLDLDLVLQEMSEKYQTPAHATDIAADTYGLDAKILDDRFQHLSNWDIEKQLSAALVNLAESRHNLMARRNSLQDSARERLQLGLARFTSHLDPDILSRLAHPNSFVPSDYNYFAVRNPIVRRNRLQGNQIFGLVFGDFTDLTPPNILLTTLARAVDAGKSLVPVLSDREKLSPAVAKLILKCPKAVFINPWRKDIHSMGQLLSVLEPAYWPKSAREWVMLHGCAKAMKDTLHLDWSGPVFKSWLNDAAQAKYDLWTDDLERDIVCRIIVEMTQAVAGVVVNTDRGTEAGNALGNRVYKTVWEYVWEYLGRQRLGKVLDMARAWQQAFERAQEKLVSEKMEASDVRWPAVVEYFSTPTRLVIPLVTPEDLFSEGLAMRHCVATYTRACSKGEVQIWSIRTQGDIRCTTLATQFRGEEGTEAQVMQHHSACNGPADPESAAAADALIEHITSGKQGFSEFHAWRKSKPPVEERFTEPTLADQISFMAVKASVPVLLEVGMKSCAPTIETNLASACAGGPTVKLE